MASLGKIRRWVLVAFAVDLLLLGASGLYLAFRYRPTAGEAWPQLHVAASTAQAKPWLLAVSESAHKVSAVAALLLAVVLVVLVVAAAWKRSWGPRVAGSLGSVGLLGALLAGVVWGSRLAWTQLALWAVVVGNKIQGVWLPASAKYVFLKNAEVDPANYRQAVWLHVAAIPAVVVLALVVLVLAARPRVVPPASEPIPMSPTPDLKPVG